MQLQTQYLILLAFAIISCTKNKPEAKEEPKEEREPITYLKQSEYHKSDVDPFPKVLQISDTVSAGDWLVVSVWLNSGMFQTLADNEGLGLEYNIRYLINQDSYQNVDGPYSDTINFAIPTDNLERGKKHRATLFLEASFKRNGKFFQDTTHVKPFEFYIKN